jgi:monoamine oxidase
MRVDTGSASVALRMAEELGERVRLTAVVERIEVEPQRCCVTLRGGETLESEVVVSAVPVGPLRRILISGISEVRLASLCRQRHALAGKVVVAYREAFWRKRGADGFAGCEGFFGSTWAQSEGVLSILVPPERFAAFVAAPEPSRREAVFDQLARLYGEEALDADAYRTREWGTDPFTLGYITSWAPGDVMKVGPLHGTHEPPFYVCGSDQWVAGYMEGAVRTGRGAAKAALGGTAAAAARPDQA